MTDEARLQRWIDSHRDGGEGLASVHIDVDTLLRHAAGQLSPARAQRVDEHLRACEDGRCPEFLRSQGMDGEAVSDRLQTNEVAAADDTLERTFRLRGIVWATFESMAYELGVSIDVLVNEAMEAYALARGYGAPPSDPITPRRVRADVEPLTDPEPRDVASGRPRSSRDHRIDDDIDDLARTAARDVRKRPEPSPPSDARPSRLSPRTNPLPTLPRPAALPLTPPPGRPPPARSQARPIPPPSPPPPSRQDRGFTPTPSSVRQLMLEYRGRLHAVDKERFLIGRSKTQADLRLDDPNVSRQHAVIERVGAAWYIVDLGSTNGVHVAGERVTRRALSDADVIVITTHEIRCTLR